MLAANPVECRSGGGTNSHQIVLEFPNGVTFSGANVMISAGVGTVSSSTGSGTTTVTSNLTDVANAQKITVKILGLTETANPANTGDLGVTMGVLIGDTNGSRSVTSADIGHTKAAAAAGVVNTGTFRTDVNVNGTVNSSDIGQVKAASGTSIP